MSAQFVSKIIRFAFTVALLTCEPLEAQSGSHSSPEPEFSAIDTKGIRHDPSDYGDKRAPWVIDRIKFVQPNYPVEARARHKQGTGVFRISLDVKTGSVTNVSVVKSTGFSVLDDSAIKAIRLWRWRPNRWKEVDIPVAFTMGPNRRSSGAPDDELARAKTYYKKGEINNAIEAFDEAIRQKPTLVDAYISRGATYQARDDAAKALADFDKAIQLDPKSARAHCDRAALEEELLHEPGKALADYDQAIRLAPEFHRAYFNRGVYFLGRLDYRPAVADFSRAVQLIPNDGDGYALRAYAYAKLGEHSRAGADAAAAIKLKPSEPSLFRSTDLAIRSKAYVVLGQPESALRDLREAVRLRPEASVVNDNLAWFLATYPNERFRNGTEAIAVAKKACELSHGQRVGCSDTLAAAYAEAGDFEQAVKYEKQALTDSSLPPKQREEFEKRLSLFEERKPFREKF